jgi:hypothetical protein
MLAAWQHAVMLDVQRLACVSTGINRRVDGCDRTLYDACRSTQMLHWTRTHQTAMTALCQMMVSS